MAAAKNRIPTEEEKNILRRNGIEPEGFVVRHRTENAIHLIRLKTRDEICVYQGDRKWKDYTN